MSFFGELCSYLFLPKDCHSGGGESELGRSPPRSRVRPAATVSTGPVGSRGGRLLPARCALATQGPQAQPGLALLTAQSPPKALRSGVLTHFTASCRDEQSSEVLPPPQFIYVLFRSRCCGSARWVVPGTCGSPTGERARLSGCQGPAGTAPAPPHVVGRL